LWVLGIIPNGDFMDVFWVNFGMKIDLESGCLCV